MNCLIFARLLSTYIHSVYFLVGMLQHRLCIHVYGHSMLFLNICVRWPPSFFFRIAPSLTEVCMGCLCLDNDHISQYNGFCIAAAFPGVAGLCRILNKRRNGVLSIYPLDGNAVFSLRNCIKLPFQKHNGNGAEDI